VGVQSAVVKQTTTFVKVVAGMHTQEIAGSALHAMALDRLAAGGPPDEPSTGGMLLCPPCPSTAISQSSIPFSAVPMSATGWAGRSAGGAGETLELSGFMTSARHTFD
jgi:hypothetical protein